MEFFLQKWGLIRDLSILFDVPPKKPDETHGSAKIPPVHRKTASPSEIVGNIAKR